jgi:hypothetical protein
MAAVESSRPIATWSGGWPGSVVPFLGAGANLCGRPSDGQHGLPAQEPRTLNDFATSETIARTVSGFLRHPAVR